MYKLDINCGHVNDIKVSLSVQSHGGATYVTLFYHCPLHNIPNLYIVVSLILIKIKIKINYNVLLHVRSDE